MDINQFYVRDDVSRATAGKKRNYNTEQNQNAEEICHRHFRKFAQKVSVRKPSRDCILFFILSFTPFLGIVAWFEIMRYMFMQVAWESEFHGTKATSDALDWHN